MASALRAGHPALARPQDYPQLAAFFLPWVSTGEFPQLSRSSWAHPQAMAQETLGISLMVCSLAV